MEDHRGDIPYTPQLAAMCESCHGWRAIKNVNWMPRLQQWRCIWCIDGDDEMGANLAQWLEHHHPAPPPNDGNNA